MKISYKDAIIALQASEEIEKITLPMRDLLRIVPLLRELRERANDFEAARLKIVAQYTDPETNRVPLEEIERANAEIGDALETEFELTSPFEPIQPPENMVTSIGTIEKTIWMWRH